MIERGNHQRLFNALINGWERRLFGPTQKIRSVVRTNYLKTFSFHDTIA
jgi:hypothetical protein